MSGISDEKAKMKKINDINEKAKKNQKNYLGFFKNKVYTMGHYTRYPIKNYKQQKFFYYGEYIIHKKSLPNSEDTFKIIHQIYYLMANNFKNLKNEIIKYYIK